MPSILDLTLSSADECWAWPGVLAMPFRKRSGSQGSGSAHNVRHHLGLCCVQGGTMPAALCRDRPSRAVIMTWVPCGSAPSWPLWAQGHLQTPAKLQVRPEWQSVCWCNGLAREYFSGQDTSGSAGVAPCWLQEVQGPQAVSCPLTRLAQLHCMMQSPSLLPWNQHTQPAAVILPLRLLDTNRL